MPDPAPDPNMADETLVQAMSFLRAGQREPAKRLLLEKVAADPNHALGWHLLGSIAHEEGRLTEAIGFVERTVAIEPHQATLHVNLAELYRLQGDRDRAVQSAREAVRLAPQLPVAHNNLGLALQALGQTSAAETYFRRTTELAPRHFRAHYNLGRLLLEQNNFPHAIACFSAACQIQPDFVPALDALGIAHVGQQQFAEAIAWFRRAIQHAPARVKSWRNLARAYEVLGELAQALTAQRKVCELAPNDGEAFREAGRLLERQEHFAEAADLYRKLADLEQSSAAYLQLGNALRAAGRRSGAIDAYRQALSKSPESAEVLANLTHTAAEICSWSERQPQIERLLHEVSTALANGLTEPLTPSAALVFGVPADQHLQIARYSSARIAASTAPLRDQFAFSHPRGTRERLRIGYLSADFRNHPTSHLMQGVFGKHDRSKFEIIAYSIGPDDDSEYRRRIARDCDRFVDAARWENGRLAQNIHADRVDILVDLMGHTSRGRPDVLALRPAPIQAHYLGYAGSMGAEFVDYMFVDHITVPPELAPHYSENLVYLPHSYQCNDDRQRIASNDISRAEERLPPDACVFCCFNNSFKIEPAIFNAWMRILHAVPNSVLWLLAKWPEVEQNLRREAEARQIDPNRLIFATSRPKDEHLSRQRLADLFLDTPICNAHTTASDSLWAGVPMLTYPGETFACRVGASLVSAVGLPELIVTNLPAYEELAIDLARNPARLSQLKSTLNATRSSSPLFDTSRFVRNLERAYREMWRRFETASPLGPIEVVETG